MRAVLVNDDHVDEVGTADACDHQLVSLINKLTMRYQPHLQLQVFHPLQILIEHQQFKILRTCKIEVPSLRVAHTLDKFSFGGRHETGVEVAFESEWIPHMDGFVVESGQAAI